MIAPRKTLWSTPLCAVDHCMERVPLKNNDIVCDIGCGDGRILHRWAVLLSNLLRARGGERIRETISFVGIDIDQDRIEDAKKKTEELKSHGRILPNITVAFFCRNALEASDVIESATVIFLYLIPRGLKRIYPLIVKGDTAKQKNLRVISYMSKLPIGEPDSRALCRGEHQKEAAWPLYFYSFQNEAERS